MNAGPPATSPALSVARAAVVGPLTVLIAVAAHTAGGGGPLTPATFAWPAAAAAVATVVLLAFGRLFPRGRWLPWLALATAVQLAVHRFMPCGPTGAGCCPEPCGQTADPTTAALPGIHQGMHQGMSHDMSSMTHTGPSAAHGAASHLAHAGHDSVRMYAWHVSAALVSGLLLSHGEAVLRRLCAALVARVPAPRTVRFATPIAALPVVQQPLRLRPALTPGRVGRRGPPGRGLVLA